MKGTIYDGDHFADKGMSASYGEFMFSVGNLVAFSYKSHSSPDGFQGRRGANLLTSPYLLQDEIVLEEYDRTESDRFGSGSKDIKKIVELSDLWKHYEASWERHGGYEKYFLCQILDTNAPQLEEPYKINSRIEEVRENKGKWLHVYELQQSDWKIAKQANSFSEAIQRIKKESPKNKAEYGLKNWRTGAELPIWLRHNHYYQPNAWIGGDGSTSDFERGVTNRAGWLKISPEVSLGAEIILFVWGWPAQLTVPSTPTGTPSVSLWTHCSFANSQNWWIAKPTETILQQGWVTLNGEDLYIETIKEVSQNKAAIIAARKEKFAEAKAEAKEAGFNDSQIQRIIKNSLKGRVIATIKVATTLATKYDNKEFIINILKDVKSEYPGIAPGYAFLSANAENIKFSNVKRTIEKAYAWKYILDLIPGYDNEHQDFDDAINAMKFALKKGLPFQGSPGKWTSEEQALKKRPIPKG